MSKYLSHTTWVEAATVTRNSQPQKKPMVNTMVGPPPISPAQAPPIKKQRAGNTPQDAFTQRADNAMSRRRQELQKLNQKTSNPLMDRARMSLGENGPPRGPPAGGPYGGPPSVPPSGGPPTASYANQPRAAPPMRGPASFSPQAYGNQAPTVSSTAVPSAAKLASPVSQKPTMNDSKLLSPRSKLPSPRSSGAAVTAAAVMSPRKSPDSADKNIARRLENTFSPPASSRSKSAPPTRPPPPPGPPPLTKEALESTKKAVSFQSPVAANAPPPPNGAHTPENPEETTRNVAPTPFNNKMNAGATPYHGPYEPTAREEKLLKGAPPTVIQEDLLKGTHYSRDPEPTPARKYWLKSMREAADTPAGKEESPELRMHRELANSLSEKSDALRKISELEDELNTKTVSFLSPTNFRNGGKRQFATPFPKRNTPKPSTPIEVKEEKDRLIKAAQSVPFEYSFNGDVTFVVRRPYGLASEHDLWFKVGQLNNKMYGSSADVDFPSTIELAAKLEDDSIVVLHGTDKIFHHKNDDGGSLDLKLSQIVAVIDNEGNEKEHSVEDLFRAALAVRTTYCSAVVSTADALKDYSSSVTSPQAVASPQAMVPPKPAVQTNEKGINTDKVKEVPKERKEVKKQEPPPDDGMDVMGTFLYLFGKLFGLIWFVVVGIPMKIITNTIIVIGVGILVSILWLYLVEDGGAMEMVSMLGYQSNPARIM